MAYMEQNKISRLCTIINNMESQYLFYVQNEISDIVNWFNNYWISTKSKKIAHELCQDIKVYTNNISKIFKELNSKIKKDVIQYNRNRKNNKKIFYKGFSVSKPYNINHLANLNKTLPNGKRGSLYRETDMDYPIQRLKLLSDEISLTLKRAIIKCDVLTHEEQQNIIMLIISNEKQFINKVEDILQIIVQKEN